MAPLGEYVILVGFDEAHGRELWRTDGTPEGTGLLKDINEGPAHSRIVNFCFWRDELYFGADNGACGKELWKTDGTPEGTVLIKDHFPGPSDGDPHYYAAGEEWLFYLAVDGTHGKELWRTGGEPENTVLVMDLRPGPTGSEPWDLTPFKGKLYICATSAAYGEEIFVSDGTAKGTHILKDIVPGEGHSGPDNLTVLGGQLFFTCDDGIHGEELWVTDGTPEGTRLAADIYPIRMNPSSSPRNLTAVGDQLFFTVYHHLTGKELWVSDGTFDGTRLVRDIAPGSRDSFPDNLTALGNKLFFTADTAEHGRELWVSDGSPEGTRLVEDIWEGPEGSRPNHLCADGKSLFFAAVDDTGRESLWRYAPDVASLVKAPVPVPEHEGARINAIFPMFDCVYTYLVDATSKARLYRVENTRDTLTPVIEGEGSPPVSPISAAKTPGMTRAQLVRLIRPPGPPRTRDTVCYLGKMLLCVIPARRFGTELFCVHPNPLEIHLVRDIFPGPASSGPAYLCEAGGAVYFSAEHASEGRMLWKTDGTPEGTGLVMGQAAAVASFPIPAYEVASLDHTLVVVSEPGRPEVLTHENIEVRLIPLDRPIEFDLLVDIRVGNEGSWPRQLTRAGNQVFFTADDGIHGEELWVTDGTGAGTRLVKDILTPADLAPRAP